MLTEEPGHRRALSLRAQGKEEVITGNHRGDQEIACITRSIVEQDTLLPAQGPDAVVERRIRGRRDDCKCPVQQSAYLPIRQVPDIAGDPFHINPGEMWGK